jgi:hypothetical protein
VTVVDNESEGWMKQMISSERLEIYERPSQVERQIEAREDPVQKSLKALRLACRS